MEFFGGGGGKLKLVNSLLIPVFFSVLQKQDGKEDDSKGICTADKWYSPKGKSIPCALLIIVMWIIFFPLIYCICSLFSFVVCCFSVFDPPLYVWWFRKWKTLVK